jgi:hypothetical protein
MTAATLVMAACAVLTLLVVAYASPAGRPLRARRAARRVARDEDEQVRRIILGTPEVRLRGTVVQPRQAGLQEKIAADVAAIRVTVENASLLNGKGERLIVDVGALRQWTVEHTELHDATAGLPRREPDAT